MPSCGRPGAVSSILTAMSGSFGAFPNPVSGLTAAWCLGCTLGFGVGFGAGFADELVDGGGGGGGEELGADEPLLVHEAANRVRTPSEILKVAAMAVAPCRRCRS